MIKSLFFVLTFFYLGLGFSQSKLADEYKRIPADWYRTDFLTSDDKKYFETQYSELDNARSSLATLEKDYKKDEADANTCGGFLRGKIAFDKCSEEVQTKKTNLATLDRRLQTARQTYDTKKTAYNSEFNTAIERLNQNKTNAEENKNAKLAMENRARSIDAEFSRLKLSALDIIFDAGKFKDEMGKMEKKIDDSRLGAYMMQKMANLLNSKKICEVAANCASGVANDVKPTALNEIFTNLNDFPKPGKLIVPIRGPIPDGTQQ